MLLYQSWGYCKYSGANTKASDWYFISCSAVVFKVMPSLRQESFNVYTIELFYSLVPTTSNNMYCIRASAVLCTVMVNLRQVTLYLSELELL